jgi:amino acid transporter
VTEVTTPVSNRAPQPVTGLVPVLGYRDLVLFYLVAVFGLRLIPLGASIGPAVVAFWIIAFLCYCAPLGLAVADLSSRFPEEGGIYVWSRRAFGDFHGFMTAWTYWTANLAYFPSILLFAASQSAFVMLDYAALADNKTYLLSWSLIAIFVVMIVNVIGLRIATWFHNLSAAARLLPAALILGLGVHAWFSRGPATDFSVVNWIPNVSGLGQLFLLSTLAYMFAGFESASTLGDEVRDPRRNIPRALLSAGLAITALYILLSLCLMILVPASELTGLKGFADAVGAGATYLGGERFGAAATAFSSAMLIIMTLGSASVWFAATARLPFVVGLDRYLPAAFGRIHQKFHTPWVACVFLAGATMILILLSGLGGGAAQIYNILISLEIVIFFVPNLYLFASLIRLRGVQPGPEAIRVPGRRIGTLVIGAAGFLVTAASLAFALIPGEEVENVTLFYASVLGSLTLNLACGVGLYLFGRWRRQSAHRIQSEDTGSINAQHEN